MKEYKGYVYPIALQKPLLEKVKANVKAIEEGINNPSNETMNNNAVNECWRISLSLVRLVKQRVLTGSEFYLLNDIIECNVAKLNHYF